MKRMRNLNVAPPLSWHKTRLRPAPPTPESIGRKYGVSKDCYGTQGEPVKRSLISECCTHDITDIAVKGE